MLQRLNMVHRNFLEDKELKTGDTATREDKADDFLYYHRQNMTGTSRELNAPMETGWAETLLAEGFNPTSASSYSSSTTTTTFPDTSEVVDAVEDSEPSISSQISRHAGSEFHGVTNSSDSSFTSSLDVAVTSSGKDLDVEDHTDFAPNQTFSDLVWPRDSATPDESSIQLKNFLSSTNSSHEGSNLTNISVGQDWLENWNVTSPDSRHGNKTVPQWENYVNLTGFMADGAQRYPEMVGLNDTFFGINESSFSSGPHAVNSTFQFKTNVSADEPVSFNFDLFPLFTLRPHSASEDYDVIASAAEEVTSVTVLKVIILALISLVGSFGNVLVIWSIVKERHLHRPPFYFLLSLGVTDLSRAVFCVPVVITTVLHGSAWRHGESACKLFAFATSFFVFSSALSLLAISIDRHISIVYSKTYRRRSPGIVNLVVAVVIWIIAFSVSFPPVVGIGDYVFIPDEAQCAYQHKHYTHNDSVASVLVFLAILMLTYFLYFRIFRFLRCHRRMRPLQHTPALSSNWAFVGPGANGQAFINWLNGFGGQVPTRQGGQRTVQRLNFGRVVNLSTAKNEHLTRLFLVLTLVFGITWSPYVVLSVWRIFFDTSVIPSSYVTVAAWLGYAQVALCPAVYFMARGPARRPSRTVYSHAEKREFLLENKIGK